LKKLVMLRPCRATFNPGATSSLCPLPQPQTPSRAAGSFNGQIKTFGTSPQAPPYGASCWIQPVKGETDGKNYQSSQSGDEIGAIAPISKKK